MNKNTVAFVITVNIWSLVKKMETYNNKLIKKTNSDIDGGGGNTILINLKNATRSHLNKCLKNGICEVKTTNNKGEKEIIYCTLKEFHMESEKENDWVDYPYESDILVVWDMNGNEWRGGKWVQILINNITHFEQLTGVIKT